MMRFENICGILTPVISNISQRHFIRRLPIRLGAVAIAGWLLASCAVAPPTTKLDSGLAAGDVDSLYAQIRSDFEAGRFEDVEVKSRALVHAAPGFVRADEVHLLAARASVQREDYEQAAKHATAVDSKFPLSPHREEALFIAAESHRQLEQYYASADLLSKVLSSPVGPDMQSRAVSALRDLAQDRLSVKDLNRLITAYPASPLAGEMALGLAKREFTRGNYDKAYALLTQLLTEFPQHKRAPEVRQLQSLAASRRDNPDRRAEYVEPYKVGLLLPQTGKYSSYGRYFEQGAKMAIEEFNANHEIPVSFVTADSKRDPVDAVNGIRRLVIEEGVIAVLGGVYSTPTVAAATEANAWKVPLVSPAAKRERIDEVGPWVFQTKIPVELEVSAMAMLARDNLLLERFAVLAPDSRDKRQLAEFFIQEVKNRGGRVVAELYYKPGASDFKDQLQTIRQSAPDALFVPGEPEELILLLPQVAFYDLQIQLLGLSNWNADKLLRLSQRELEGAVFPMEAQYGKDRESFEYFQSRYAELHRGDADPTAVAAFFGMRLLLQAISAGAVERSQVRDFLAEQLHGGAEQRRASTYSLPIVRVRAGKVHEFTAFNR